METIWLSDDEEIDLYEYYELLEEARKDVDKRYPRGEIQMSRIRVWGSRRWLETHNVWLDLVRQFERDD